jgi:hypothetical protein
MRGFHDWLKQRSSTLFMLSGWNVIEIVREQCAKESIKQSCNTPMEAKGGEDV